MKRPLFFVAFVAALLLFLLQIQHPEWMRPSSVKVEEDKSKSLYGLSQGNGITICGTIKEYSYQKQQREYSSNPYECLTTELILTNVYLMPQHEANSKENPQYPKITQTGQSILVYLDQELPIAIGSRGIFNGTLSFFEKATNPGEFDAERYYQNKDILFAVKKAKLLGCSREKHHLLQALKEFRQRQEMLLDTYLPTGNAAIMKAMLFGNKKEMEEETKELYQNNGIAHILAISGLHISLLGMLLYGLLQRLPLPHQIALFGSSFFLLIYGCMVGLSASTFRAILMFAFFLTAKLLKRSYDMLTALAVSFLLQIAIHPRYIFDCGFQLSYAAILGIGMLQPALEKAAEKIKHRYLKKCVLFLLPSISVNLMTAPILIYHYYELSLFSIVLNLIVLPLLKPLLLSGIGLLCIVNVSIPGSQFFIEISSAFVNGILFIYEMGCRGLEMLPIGRKNIAPMSPLQMSLYYMLLLLVTMLVNEKRHWYQLGCIIAAGLLLLYPKKLDSSVWFLDVGQGDCCVIFTEEGNCFIIDCGSSSKSNVGKKILLPFLKYHGIRRIHGIIVTHPDADHINGIEELLTLAEKENLVTEAVYLYQKGSKNEGEKWEDLLLSAKTSGVEVYEMAQKDVLRAGRLSLECLYPLSWQEQLTGNAASLVMKAEYGNFVGIFTGDLEMEGERILLREYMQADKTIQCDVLKVAHHGSLGASSLEFLQWLSPDYAVISCGKNNRYGHPHEEALKRLQETGCRIAVTSRNGAVGIKMQ